MFDPKEYKKKWYQENKERLLEKSKLYRLEHKEKYQDYTKQYLKDNKEKFKKYREENKEKIKQNKKKWDAENNERIMWHSAKRRAKAKNLPFTILVEDIVIPEYCPVFGFKLERSTSNRPLENSPSLDRIIPELGYTKGNVHVISHKANTIKNNATLEELELLVTYTKQLLRK